MVPFITACSSSSTWNRRHHFRLGFGGSECGIDKDDPMGFVKVTTDTGELIRELIFAFNFDIPVEGGVVWSPPLYECLHWDDWSEALKSAGALDAECCPGDDKICCLQLRLSSEALIDWQKQDSVSFGLNGLQGDGVDGVFGDCCGEVSASRHQISLSGVWNPLGWFGSQDSAASRLNSDCYACTWLLLYCIHLICSIWRILARFLLRVNTTAPIAVPTMITITPKVTLDPAFRTEAAIRRRSLEAAIQMINAYFCDKKWGILT